jgi:hypothetical protein
MAHWAKRCAIIVQKRDIFPRASNSLHLALVDLARQGLIYFPALISLGFEGGEFDSGFAEAFGLGSKDKPH